MKKILNFLIIIFFCLNIFNNSNTINAYNQDDENQYDKFSSENYNYIIITTDELVNSLKSFELWKSFLGYSVKTFTLEWIIENYHGIDVQEKIKNFLLDNYDEFGIEYLLFVGSRNVIPMREVFTISSEFEEGYGSLFTDYYYADINGDWDSDNDGLYGEYGHDDIDFYPEIHIGRIPCDDPEIVNEIFKRNIMYESDKSDWKKNVLLLGAITYYENLEANNHIYNRSDGATLMEECRTDIFESEDFNCYRMYETEGLRPSTYDFDISLNYSNVLKEWINGYSIVNMVGHANQVSITRYIWHRDDGNNLPEINKNELLHRIFLQMSDSDRLFLDKPPIVFTSGCSQLRTLNNMGRSFIEDGAAIAFIGSTDFGLYNITKVWRDESDGGLFSLNYYFFNFFIKENQKCGEALSNSKTFFYEHFWFTNESNYEWIWRCYSTIFGFTLYGDPSLGLIYQRKEVNKSNFHYLQFNFIFDKLSQILSKNI